MTSASREVQLEERNIIVIFAAWSFSLTIRNSIIRSSITQSIHVLYSRCMAGTFCIADQALSRRESLFTLTCQKSENATLQKIGVRIFGIIFETLGNRRGKRRACISIPEKIHNISLNVNLAKYRGERNAGFGVKNPLWAYPECLPESVCLIGALYVFDAIHWHLFALIKYATITIRLPKESFSL